MITKSKSKQTLLAVDSLTKQFGGHRVLSEVSFEVYAGEITGIIGPNGAGKTTCFNCIAGELTPDGGTIKFKDRPIGGMKPHGVYKTGLHRTFQIPRPIDSVSLVENVMLPYRQQMGERALVALFSAMSQKQRNFGAMSAVLTRLKLEKLAFKPPSALSKLQRKLSDLAGGLTKVQRQEERIFEDALAMLRLLNLEKLAFEPARVLSGGQKKLLELARVLVDDPQIVLLDEPTAGVNPTLGAKIGAHLKQICEERNLTFLMVSHDMSVVRNICKRVIVMANGEILTEGTPDEVTNDERVQRAYLGTERAQ